MQNNLHTNIKSPSIFRGVFCLFLLFIGFYSFAQPKIKFKELKKNFGFVKKGEIVTIEFEFTNVGTQPVIINEAKATCSCTSVDFSEEPISPNHSSKITIKFDTKSAYGRQDRVVEVTSNDETNYKIRFKGVVLK